MAGSYEYWQKALALTGGKRALTRDEMKNLRLVDEPQSGFWRRRTVRGGPFVPVALWHDGERMIALQDGKEIEADTVWSYCAPHPIPEAWYHDRTAGKPWPDEDTAVTESFAPPAGVGHNEGPQDEFAALQDQIDAASKNAGDYEKIESDEVAAKAQALRSRLNELSGQADKKREAEKKPHLEAGRAVDARWKPLVDGPKALADKIRRALGAWETEKDRKRREAEAEAARKAAEAAAKAVKTGKPATAPVAAPVTEEAPQTTIRGASGRAATIREVKKAKVVDYDALWGSLKTHPEMKALMDRLAQRAVDAGVHVAGIVIETEKEVR